MGLQSFTLGLQSCRRFSGLFYGIWGCYSKNSYFYRADGNRSVAGLKKINNEKNLQLIFSALLILILQTSKAQYTKIFDFTGTVNGSAPSGDLISDGTYLYGMTSTGGANNKGVIFKIKPDGTGYVDMLDFAGTTNGKGPLGSLISDGTFLYGMTATGGAGDYGVIFKIMPDGTGYLKLMDFVYATSGSNPNGSLYYDGTFLYGTTLNGGAHGAGTIFKIKPDGTGYVNLMSFATTNGNGPQGTLISDGTYLYGTTTAGGAQSMGILFKIKPDGTGFTDIFDFAGMTNGSTPQGALLSVGNYLYGLTTFGGANSYGTIFKIKPDGTGYVDMRDFPGFPTGSNPWGSLITDGTYLYGMSRNNGAYNGTIFKIMPDGTGYADLYDFVDPNNGAGPQGSLFAIGNNLYGTTSMGGTSSMGTIFKMGISTGINEVNSEAKLNIYPNPATTTLTIHQATSSPNSQVIITDVLGNELYKETLAGIDKTIEISTWNSGVYFYEVRSGLPSPSSTRGKFVKQ